MRRRDAEKDRAFDNYSAELYRHNQSADWMQSISALQLQRQKCDYYW